GHSAAEYIRFMRITLPQFKKPAGREVPRAVAKLDKIMLRLILPDGFPDHVPDVAARHLDVEKGCDGGRDVRHTHRAVAAAAAFDAPAHPYQRNVGIVRVPKPVCGAVSAAVLHTGVHDDN